MIIAGVAALLGVPGSALAADPPDPPAPTARCTLADPRLAETSGLAWAPDGVRVVNDSGNPSTVYRLAPDCAVSATRAVALPGRDVEDLARAADGTLWLADTGDNDRARATVAVLRLPPGGGELVTRLTYPDGPHDAETLLLPGDGRPVIVTKEPGGRGRIYTTDAPLPATATPTTASLRRAGDVVLPPSDTPNTGGSGLSALLGGALITGGAVSADGRVVALRTYTDAWLYPARSTASADDVVAALAGTPTRVPLPGEPQGESMTFTPDGTLLTASESPTGGPRGQLRSVPGATGLVDRPVEPPPAAAPAPGQAPAPPASDPLLAVVVGVVLLVLVGGGLVLVTRGRRR